MSSSEGSGYSRRDVITTGLLAGIGMTVVRPSWSIAAEKELPLITRAIPSTGEKLPVIGLGTNAYGVSEPGEIAARRAVLKRMQELGGTVVDTAQAYGRSEEVLDQLMTELGNRSHFFLATKTPLAGDVSQAEAVVEESFRRLGTERLDLMQIHNLYGTDTLLPVMREFKKAGRVRYLGITTSTARQYPGLLAAMRAEPFDFIQVDYSIENRNAADEVLPLAQERGMAVLINMPLGGRRGGNLLGTVRGRELPEWAAEIDVTSWPQFLLKYAASHPAVTAVIPGTTKVSHAEDNHRAARGRLPDAAMRRRMEEYWESLAT